MNYYDEVKPTAAELGFLELMGIKKEDKFIDKERNQEFSIMRKVPEKDKRFKAEFAYEFIGDGEEIIFHREPGFPFRNSYSGVSLTRNGKRYTFGEINPMNDLSPRKGFIDKWIKYDSEIDYEINIRYDIHGGNFFTVEFNAGGSYTNINCSIDGIEFFRPDDGRYRYDLTGIIFEKFYMDAVDNDLDDPRLKDVREFALKVYPLVYNEFKNSLIMPILFKGDFYDYIQKEILRVHQDFTRTVNEALEKQERSLARIDEEKSKLDSYINVYMSSEENKTQSQR